MCQGMGVPSHPPTRLVVAQPVAGPATIGPTNSTWAPRAIDAQLVSWPAWDAGTTTGTLWFGGMTLTPLTGTGSHVPAGIVLCCTIRSAAWALSPGARVTVSTSSPSVRPADLPTWAGALPSGPSETKLTPGYPRSVQTAGVEFCITTDA